jgi:hypothetical protein
MRALVASPSRGRAAGAGSSLLTLASVFIAMSPKILGERTDRRGGGDVGSLRPNR